MPSPASLYTQTRTLRHFADTEKLQLASNGTSVVFETFRFSFVAQTDAALSFLRVNGVDGLGMIETVIGRCVEEDMSLVVHDVDGNVVALQINTDFALLPSSAYASLLEKYQEYGYKSERGRDFVTLLTFATASQAEKIASLLLSLRSIVLREFGYSRSFAVGLGESSTPLLTDIKEVAEIAVGEKLLRLYRSETEGGVREKQVQVFENVKNDLGLEVQADGHILNYKGFEVSFLRHTDADGVSEMQNLINSTFEKHEKFVKHLGATARDFGVTYGDRSVEQSASEHLAVVVRDPATKTIVSAIALLDMAFEDEVPVETVPTRMRPYVSIFNELLDVFYEKIGSPSPGEILHVYVVATLETFTGRGFVNLLNNICLQVAKVFRFNSVLAEPTGAATQHVYRKLGFQVVQQVHYKDFEYEGARAFHEVVGDTDVIQNVLLKL